MSIVRLIHVKVPDEHAAKAEHVWNQDCGPLMRQAPGCVSEMLLKCRDEPGEYISYSEWENDAAIEAYRKSEAHKVIQRHARELQGAQAIVKRYNVID